MDLVNSGISCLVMIHEHDSKADTSLDATNMSRISLYQYDTNARFPHLSAIGRDCRYNLLIFSSVDSSLHFLNRQSKFDPWLPIIISNFRSFRHEETNQDTNYFRRNDSLYIHVLNSHEGPDVVNSLFSSDFYNKLMTVMVFTRKGAAKDSFLMWTKSPCNSVGPKVTNTWTKYSGFRQSMENLT